jgi:quercetin dioxygenase-like cupin family protein
MRVVTMSGRSRARIGVILGATLLGLVLIGPGVVRATHGGLHPTILARAPFADPFSMKVKAHVGGKQELAQVHDAADTIVQEVIVDPGGFTGWHTHPGPAIVVVKEGTFTYYDGEDPTCTPFPYGPGETFVDLGQGHVHSAWNHSTTIPVKVYVTYFDVPPEVPSPFIAAGDPGFCEGF